MNIRDALKFEEFYQNNTDKMQVSTAYKLMKIHEALKNDAEFYKEELNKIINQYAVLDEKNEIVIENGQILMDSSKAAEWQNKIEELNNLEIEKPNVIFKIEELKVVRFTLKEIELLSMFIEE